MRTQLIQRIEHGETDGLSPLVIEALPDIRLPSKRLEERTSTQG